MSKRALRLIKKEKREKTGYLDLRNCYIRSWPDELFDCVWLETLIMSGDYWDYKKEELIYTTNTGRSNKLSEVPTSIKHLKQLKTLILRGFGRKDKSPISDLRPIGELSSLTRLDLCYNQIVKLEGLENLCSLVELDLGFNQITQLEGLENLRSLRKLYVNMNQISNIEELGLEAVLNAGRITHLNLSGNKIKDLRPLLSLIKKGLRVRWDFHGDGICIERNPLEIPPVEIAKKGSYDVDVFFQNIEKQ